MYAYETQLSKIKGKFIPRWTGPWEVKVVKYGGNAYTIELEGKTREVNVDSLIKEEIDFETEEMKKPPLGMDGDKIEDEKEDLGLDPQEEDEDVKKILKNLEEKLLKEKEEKKQKEGKGEGKKGKKRESKDVKEEKKTDIKNSEEDEDGYVDGRKGDKIKPLKLAPLQKQTQYKPDDLKLGHYALVQSGNTRYLVSIWERYGDKFEGHYLLSREPQKPDRKYSKAWWDTRAGKIHIGGVNLRKHKGMTPMCDFRS